MWQRAASSPPLLLTALIQQLFYHVFFYNATPAVPCIEAVSASCAAPLPDAAYTTDNNNRSVTRRSERRRASDVTDAVGPHHRPAGTSNLPADASTSSYLSHQQQQGVVLRHSGPTQAPCKHPLPSSLTVCRMLHPLLLLLLAASALSWPSPAVARSTRPWAVSVTDMQQAKLLADQIDTSEVSQCVTP